MKKLLIILLCLITTSAWGADSKLSELTDLNAEPASTDQFYVNDGGTSKRVDYEDFMLGNAGTATAAESEPANCPAGSYPLGVDTSWDVESCTDATTEINSVVNGLGGTNLTCAVQSCNVDDSFLVNDANDATTGTITSTGFIIGSADINETDLEKIDGITNGTAAANKAVVLDGSLDIATINSLTATTITDGTASMISGALSGVTTVSASGLVSASGVKVTTSFQNTGLLNCDTIDTDGDGNFSCGTDSGGSEINNLETITTDIAINEVPTGTAANTVVYKVIPDCNASDRALSYDDGTQTWGCTTGFAAGSTTPYNDITDPSVDSGISFAGYTNAWTSTLTASDFFNIKNTANFGDVSLFVLETSGNPTDGTILEIINTDANADSIIAPNFSLTQAGLLTTVEATVSGVLTVPVDGTTDAEGEWTWKTNPGKIQAYDTDLSDNVFYPASHASVQITIDGGDSAITADANDPVGCVRINNDLIIKQWHIYADQEGSITIDMWKGEDSALPLDNGDSINGGGEKPTLTSQVFNTDTNLTAMDTDWNAGDTVCWEIESADTVEWVGLHFIGYHD